MKEIISKNRVYIIIIIVMVIFSLLIGLLAIFNKTKNNKKLYIAFSDESIWLYSGQKYSSIASDRQSYNWLTYNIYTENKKIGNYKLYNYDEKWYAFNDNKEEITIDDTFIAFSGNLEYEVINFDTQELDSNDIDKLTDILKKDGVLFDGTLTRNKKITLDIDNDNKMEKIYSVSNVWSDTNPSEIFSLIYIEDDSKIKILKKLVNKVNSNNIAQDIYSNYDISYIVDIGKDKKYDLFIKYLSDDGVCNELYSKVKKDYVKQIGC